MSRWRAISEQCSDVYRCGSSNSAQSTKLAFCQPSLRLQWPWHVVGEAFRCLADIDPSMICYREEVVGDPKGGGPKRSSGTHCSFAGNCTSVHTAGSHLNHKLKLLKHCRNSKLEVGISPTRSFEDQAYISSHMDQHQKPFSPNDFGENI